MSVTSHFKQVTRHPVAALPKDLAARSAVQLLCKMLRRQSLLSMTGNSLFLGRALPADCAARRAVPALHKVKDLQKTRRKARCFFYSTRAVHVIKLSCLLLALFFTGCASSQSPIVRSGPFTLANVKVENWSYEGEPGKRVVTPHYVVYATVTNDEFLEAVGQLMEGALAEYRRFAPAIPDDDRPMECYLFANRPQWARFTKEKTGEDASVYLQINRGGYTVRDWYVAYFLGDVGTFCVASHEGFHQFAARYFRTRVPPFLEEG